MNNDVTMKIAQHLLLCLVACFGLVACDAVKEQTQQFTAKDDAENTPASVVALPKTVAWVAINSHANAQSRLLSGQVSAAESSHLSFESSGKIEQIYVKLGDSFKKGQALARLETTNYDLQLRQAQAALKTAIANRDQASKEVSRYQRLVSANAAPAIQLDNYNLQLKNAQQAINSAQAQIELAQKQRKDTVLYAPFSGVVTAQLSEVGQLTTPASPVFTVEMRAKPEVTLSVPENLIGHIQRGKRMVVKLPAQENIGLLTARVSEISTQAKFGAFLIKLTLDNPPPSVKSGMTAEVQLELPQSGGGFSIPPSALGAGEDNQHFVYRLHKKALDGNGDIRSRFDSNSSTYAMYHAATTNHMNKITTEVTDDTDTVTDSDIVQSIPLDATANNLSVNDSVANNTETLVVHESDSASLPSETEQAQPVLHQDVYTLESVPVDVVSFDGDSVTVLGNLLAGDKIVRSGWSFLVPNQDVFLMGDGALTINP